MKACIVPPNPGNLSAFGLLAVDWRTDHIVTKVMHEDTIDLADVAARYAALEREATATLTRDGIEASRIRLVREADMRYAGQSMEVRVTAPGGAVDAAFLAGLIGAFNAAHLRTFGYNYAGRQKIELVNLCVSGFGLIERPQMPKLAGAERQRAAPKSVRPVYFGTRVSATRRSTTAPRCRRAAASTGRHRRGIRLDHGGVSRPASSKSIRTAFLSFALSQSQEASR